MGKKIRIISPKIEYTGIASGYTYCMRCKDSSVVKIGFLRIQINDLNRLNQI